MTDIKTWPEGDEEQALFKDWQTEVANGDTLRGFRDWVAVNVDGND